MVPVAVHANTTSTTAEVCVCPAWPEPCARSEPLEGECAGGLCQLFVAPNAGDHFAVEARGVSAGENALLAVRARAGVDADAKLTVGCELACHTLEAKAVAKADAETTYAVMYYELFASPRGKVSLCVDDAFIGTLFITGADLKKVRSEADRLIVPGTNLTLDDRVALADPGAACLHAKRILAPEEMSVLEDVLGNVTVLEFVAPEPGRYKVCFCDAQEAESCADLANFFEVTEDMALGVEGGLDCLTAVPRLLQPHCRPLESGDYKCEELVAAQAAAELVPLFCARNGTNATNMTA